MNDIFNEVFGESDTSKLTPIEIALGIDNEMCIRDRHIETVGEGGGSLELSLRSGGLETINIF